MKTIRFSFLFIFISGLCFSQSWKPVGNGLSGGTSASCMFVDSSNNLLYVGGNFTNSNGFPLNKIAKWDGLNWSVVNTIAAPISAGEIAVLNGEVFIANYTNNRVWKWDGISWTSLPPFDNGIHCLTIINDTLYAGGPFTWASNRFVRGIAKWNGANWDSLGAGLSGCQCASEVNSICKYQGKLVAGGLFWTAGNDTAYNLAQWDGTTWSPIGSGITGTDMYNTYVFDLAADGTDLFAGGIFQKAGGVTVNGIARWDGTSWYSLGSPSYYYGSNLILKHNNEVFADGGNFVLFNGLGKWNGTSWQSHHSWELNGEILDMCFFNNELYLAGNFTADTTGQQLKYITRSKILQTENENPSCFNDCDGNAIASAIGILPDTYLWSTGDTTQIISNLCDGIYNVTVTDNTGSSSIGSVTVTAPSEITFIDSVIDAGCQTCTNGSASVTASGGTSSYSYLWSNGETTSTIDTLTTGTYYVTVIDANGCVAVDSVEVGFDISVNGELSIVNSLEIYPNPANETVTITAENIKEVVVTNLLGVQMMRLPRIGYNARNELCSKTNVRLKIFDIVALALCDSECLF